MREEYKSLWNCKPTADEVRRNVADGTGGGWGEAENVKNATDTKLTFINEI